MKTSFFAALVQKVDNFVNKFHDDILSSCAIITQSSDIKCDQLSGGHRICNYRELYFLSIELTSE